MPGLGPGQHPVAGNPARRRRGRAARRDPPHHRRTRRSRRPAGRRQQERPRPRLAAAGAAGYRGVLRAGADRLARQIPVGQGDRRPAQLRARCDRVHRRPARRVCRGHSPPPRGALLRRHPGCRAARVARVQPAGDHHRRRPAPQHVPGRFPAHRRTRQLHRPGRGVPPLARPGHDRQARRRRGPVPGRGTDPPHEPDERHRRALLRRRPARPDRRPGP